MENFTSTTFLLIVKSLNYLNGFLCFSPQEKHLQEVHPVFLLFSSVSFFNKIFWVPTLGSNPILDIGDREMHMTDTLVPTLTGSWQS